MHDINTDPNLTYKRPEIKVVAALHDKTSKTLLKHFHVFELSHLFPIEFFYKNQDNYGDDAQS